MHVRIFAPSNPSGGVLIYLEEPERRERFEGPYYEISSLDYLPDVSEAGLDLLTTE